MLISERTIGEALGRAGVAIDGPSPWDMRVKDARVFDRVAAEGALGLGESYMEGWWDCERLDTFSARVLAERLDETLPSGSELSFWRSLALRVNAARRTGAWEVGRRHYDLGNYLFMRMLDRRMIYSCAYWRDARDLDAAQEAKLDLVCRKLQLSRGDSLLDLGCGWGGLAAYAARRYGVSVTGVTVSREQAKYAQEIGQGLPLAIEAMDYRFVAGRYDRVVSIGMIEHVGPQHLREFFETASRALSPDGVFVLQSICNPLSTEGTSDAWMERYIFPRSVTPSLSQITATAEGLFLIEDAQEIGSHYDPTLMAWNENFQRAWPELAAHYGERFKRMWEYYLLMSAGNFRAGRSQVFQFVLAPAQRKHFWRLDDDLSRTRRKTPS